MAKEKELVVRVINGQWYATLAGRHLTAAETAKLIAGGRKYQIA